MKPKLHVVTEDESVPCRSYRDWLDDKEIPKGPWIVRAPAVCDGTALAGLRPQAALRRLDQRRSSHGAGEVA